MRKVIFSMGVSLDGFVETRDHDIGWSVPDEDLHRLANEQAREAGAFLYGRRLYELMAEFWPTADQDPSVPDYVAEFARIWRDTPKIVFSRTLTEVGPNSRLVRDDIAGEVARLKAEPGGPLAVGGPTLAASFVELGLVDEYHLFVHPVILGGGTPFFPRLDHLIDLRLTETRRFDSGVVSLRYERR